MAEPFKAPLVRRPSVIDQHLAQLLQAVCIEVQAGNELIEDGILGQLVELLDTDRAERAAEIIAEMAKSEDNRITFIQQEVIPPLVNLVQSSAPHVLRQACRGLGNMCFESQTGRQIVLTEGGIAALATRLRELQPRGETSKGENDIHYMLCGSLHTICMDHEEVQREAISHGMVQSLMEYLKHSTDPTVLRFSLNIIATLFDLGDQVTDMASELNTVPIVAKILKTEEDESVREAAVDVLGNYNFLSKPLTQMQLYQAGVLSLLVDIINTSLDESASDALDRSACEILVVVISHDGIAQLVFEDKTFDMVAEALQWLNGYQEHLKGTGAVVIGNLATSDLRSAALASNRELVDSLFAALHCDYSSDEMMVKVKHAALSALRNLSICEAAKETLRPHLPTLLSYVRSDMPMLIFKAVACVRALVRGSKATATEMAGDTQLVKVVAGLPDRFKYHSGIQGEAPRLISTLIVEAAHTCETISELVSVGVVPVVLKMTQTREYPKIQVEGWLAIQKILHLLKDHEAVLSAGLFTSCEECLSDETNPNVRILALNIIRMVSGSLKGRETMEALTAHLARLSANDGDIPAQQLAKEIKESLN